LVAVSLAKADLVAVSLAKVDLVVDSLAKADLVADLAGTRDLVLTVARVSESRNILGEGFQKTLGFLVGPSARKCGGFLR
jgi:hypothetical protein